MSLADQDTNTTARKQLTRGPNGVIAGVCAGIAGYYGISLVFMRIAFVALVFVDGIGIVIYLILILIVPTGHKTYDQSHAPTCPPPSKRKSIFAYLGMVVTVCTGLVTAYDHLAVIYDFVVGFVEADSYEPNLDNIEPISETPSGMHGTARIQWSYMETIFDAQVDMTGRTGTITVDYFDSATSSMKRVYQDAVFRYADEQVSVVGISASEPAYRPDSFGLSQGSDGTFVVELACDSEGCYPVQSASGSMQIEYR